MITKAKHYLFSITAVTLLLAVFLPCNESQARASSFTRAAAAVKKAVKANPSNAPAILADAIKNNPGGECELTKAAIAALPKGDTELLRKTIEAALKAGGGASDTIAKCARDAASWDGADAAIDQAVANAGGGGGGGSGEVPVGLVSGYSGLGFSSAGAGGCVTDSNP